MGNVNPAQIQRVRETSTLQNDSSFISFLQGAVGRYSQKKQQKQQLPLDMLKSAFSAFASTGQLRKTRPGEEGIVPGLPFQFQEKGQGTRTMPLEIGGKTVQVPVGNTLEDLNKYSTIRTREAEKGLSAASSMTAVYQSPGAWDATAEETTERGFKTREAWKRMAAGEFPVYLATDGSYYTSEELVTLGKKKAPKPIGEKPLVLWTK